MTTPRVVIPQMGRLPGIVIAALETVLPGYGIGDGEAHATKPAYPHTIVYALPSSAAQGSGGVDHQRIQTTGIQLTHVGEDRQQCDDVGDYIAEVMMGRTIRDRTYTLPLDDEHIVVIDRQFQRGQADIDNGTDVWERHDRFVFVVSVA